ncbi:uncharacterized protein [Venturia canescens]|uniref:uncharacterized protein isoform X2 n=1 Tax=Venturia canescens TaxID=32260 RepID=UPI001C9D2B6F|nr:uncharacterized protein LOC122410623 isoform X2 [Venturia canescens]
MWLKILRQNLSHLARRAKGSASIEQKNGSTKSNKTNNNGAEVNRNEDNQNGSVDVKSQAKKKSGGPGSGPLLQQAEVSSSQLDFFKMLDEKIENGPDYDESLDATMRAERISDLMRRWELASMSWSSVADLNNPVCLMMPSTENVGLSNSRQNLTAKDREGMRNIIGGRPDSAPVFGRNANRVDGLQEVNSPSANMPRHVLESITQSPTQSLKNAGSLSVCTDSPTSLHRFQDYNTKEYNANVAATINPRVSRSNYETSGGGAVNGEYVTQQALYREQYLQQTGIIAVQPQFTASHNNSPNNVVSSVLRNNPYVQQFQLANNSSPQHFASRKRGYNNTAQMT